MKLYSFIILLVLLASEAESQVPFLPGFTFPSLQTSTLAPVITTAAAATSFGDQIFNSFTAQINQLSQQLLDNIQKGILSIVGSAFNALNGSPFQNFLPQQARNITDFSQLAPLISRFANITSFSSNLISSSALSSAPEFLRKTLEQAFNQLNSALQATVGNGIQNIEKTFQSLNGTALSIIGSVQNTATASVQALETQLSQFNATVRRCVDDTTSPFQGLIYAARDGAVDCVRNKLSDGRAIIDNGRQNIADAIAGAQNLSQSLQACSSQSGQDSNIGLVGCYASALINIHSETILLPIQLTKRFGEIDEFIMSYQADAIKCVSLISEAVTRQTLNVTRAVASCLSPTRAY